MRKYVIFFIACFVLLVIGVGAGYGLRAATEHIPDPNTLNQYCVEQWGYQFLNGADATTQYQRASAYIQCAPAPLPGQGQYQP